jgi:lysyl-tRNA synthetase class II
MAWDPNPLEEQRLEKLTALREAGINPYPRRVGRTHNTAVALTTFAAWEETAEGDAPADGGRSTRQCAGYGEDGLCAY